ncbi:MAG TPA: NAD(+)/NADH kinase [Dehalococcoidia bacterium]|nr:NAD(+)/NADH kinase [Dehalococcoidia bacterium]
MNKVGICVYPRWEQAQQLGQQLSRALEGRVREIWLVSAWDDEAARLNVEGTDLLICVGGDGTVLWAARAVIPHAVPILGINMGRLGFLAELGPAEVEERLPQILDGGGRIEERAMLQAQVPAWGQTYHGLNDVVVGRASAGQPVYIDVSVDSRRLALYRADAVIVATATGSTAYSLSAGGPILHPESKNLVLTPVAPHLAAACPIVLLPDATIDLRVSTERPAVVSIDGQIDRPLSTGDRVSVCRSSYVARFLRFGEPSDYYGFLAERLDWLRIISASEHPGLFGPGGPA